MNLFGFGWKRKRQETSVLLFKYFANSEGKWLIYVFSDFGRNQARVGVRIS